MRGADCWPEPIAAGAAGGSGALGARRASAFFGRGRQAGTKDVIPALSLILGNDVTPQFLNHIDNHMVKLSK